MNDNSERWFAFSAYNSQSLYGFGTAAEADRYCDLLNADREINVYAAEELSAAYRFATTEPETVDLCGMPVKLVRQASFTYGPFDVNLIWGGIGMRQGYLVKSSYGVTEELVFVWDSTRPATPVVPQQLADSPFVQDIVAKRIAA